MAKTMEKKPELVQISSAWPTREGAPLGRNRYAELQIKKAKANGSAAKQPANQKPCEKMTDAIVMDGGNRGQIVKVCADLTCRVQHADRPSPQQLQRDRTLERKRVEKDKIAITCSRLYSTSLQACRTIGSRCWRNVTRWKSKKPVQPRQRLC